MLPKEICVLSLSGRSALFCRLPFAEEVGAFPTPLKYISGVVEPLFALPTPTPTRLPSDLTLALTTPICFFLEPKYGLEKVFTDVEVLRLNREK